MVSRRHLAGCSGLFWVGLLLLSSPGFAGPAPAPLQQAEVLIRRGDLPRAELILRQALRAKSDPQAQYLLGFVLIHRFAYAEAEHVLRQAVFQRPAQPAYRHALAKSLLEQGKSRAAIAELERAIQIDPQPDFLFARAMAALNAAELELARTSLEATVAAQPGNAEAWFQLGKLSIDQGDYTAAVVPLQRALGINDQHIEARYRLGLVERRNGNVAGAVEALERVLAAVPGHVGALLNLGQLQMQAGDNEAGRATLARFSAMSTLRDEVEFLQHAVRKNPSNLPGRLSLAGKLLEIGDADGAVAQLLEARKLAPQEPRIYTLLAQAFTAQGKSREAAQAAAFADRLRGAPDGQSR